MHRTPATALHFFFWWLHDSLTGLSSNGISTGQNSRTPNMLHDRCKTDPFHPGIQVHFGDWYPGSVLVVDPHPSQGENFTFIFKPWHVSLTCFSATYEFQYLILEICKNSVQLYNVRFQSWCRVHESQSISRWEESSDSNLPPIPCLSTTKWGNCKTHPVSRCKIMTRSGKIMLTSLNLLFDALEQVTTPFHQASPWSGPRDYSTARLRPARSRCYT